MSMIVQHYRKIKTGAGLRNVAAHNQRDKVYDDDGKLIQNPQMVGDKDHLHWLHPEHQTYNHHTHKPEKDDDGKEEKILPILERRSETIKLANLARKPQKNAAYAIEAVFSFSPDFCADWATNPKSERKLEGFFSGAAKFVRDKFGAENVLQMDAHYDEKTPHMHVLLTPIMTNDNGQKVYSSSAFLGGRAGLKKLQTDFAKMMNEKYGLERGVEGSKARHTDQVEYASQLNSKAMKLTAKEKDLERREKVVEKAEELIKKHPDGAILKELSSRLHGLSKAETNACWDAMAAKADELRASHYQVKAMAPQSELKKGKGRA